MWSCAYRHLPILNTGFTCPMCGRSNPALVAPSPPMPVSLAAPRPLPTNAIPDLLPPYAIKKEEGVVSMGLSQPCLRQYVIRQEGLLSRLQLGHQKAKEQNQTYVISNVKLRYGEVSAYFAKVKWVEYRQRIITTLQQWLPHGESGSLQINEEEHRPERYLRIAEMAGKGRGCVAREDIPAGTLLGLYVGEYLTNGYVEAHFRHHRAQDYFMEVGRQAPYVISAYPKGNCLAIINANTTYREGEPMLRANVVMCPVRVYGVSHVILIVSEDIGSGDELLMDYGQGYWDASRQVIVLDEVQDDEVVRARSPEGVSSVLGGEGEASSSSSSSSSSSANGQCAPLSGDGIQPVQAMASSVVKRQASSVVVNADIPVAKQSALMRCAQCGLPKAKVSCLPNRGDVEGRICQACYVRNKEERCGQCQTTKHGQFHPSNRVGVEGRICQACYVGNKKEHCTQCQTTKHGQFHPSNRADVEGRICYGCYMKNKEGHCAQCQTTKHGQFHPSNRAGVEGRICHACYVGNKKEHCTQCQTPKHGQFHPSNRAGVEGRICHACYVGNKKEHCTQCQTTKYGQFHTSNRADVEGRICHACYKKNRLASHG